MTPSPPNDAAGERAVAVTAGAASLEGTLAVPAGAQGVVLFAHGSGSSRHSPRNRYVARVLRDGGLATLLIDLLTLGEEMIDERTRQLRFDIGLLADRLVGTIDWLAAEPTTRALPVGLFGASTGGGAALVAAARRPERVRAVVSRGGRPDLAGDALPLVRAPTLLLVGGRDAPVVELNEQARARMRAEVRLDIVPGATHLFEEPGTLEQVARHARDWLTRRLASGVARDIAPDIAPDVAFGDRTVDRDVEQEAIDRAPGTRVEVEREVSLRPVEREGIDAVSAERDSIERPTERSVDRDAVDRD